MEELANTVSAAVASAGYAGDMLGALYVMAAWTAITWIIMTAVRIPAMNAAGLTPDDAKHTVNLNTLQGTPRQLADNYNHLFEVPVIFYALVLAIVVGGHADEMHMYCAWGFVASRVVHSLWQWTVNAVALRFPLFAIGWVLLMIMIVRELLAYIG
ncbi:MAPEG family protein [Pyruvatibacter mobilis]|uniref:MAPEG family protein n=1 Tax=Pyruvatibacter mobilis TaxID=1712261 RepID=UPI003BAD60B0